jgi:hypothetical protein
MREIELMDNAIARISVIEIPDHLAASYAFPFDLNAALKEAYDRCAAALTRVISAASHPAEVRTAAGSTFVAWNANLKSVWVDPGQAGAHLAALSLAVEKRLRLVAAVTASLRIVAALSIAAASAANPVGALFAARRLASLLEELMETAKI